MSKLSKLLICSITLEAISKASADYQIDLPVFIDDMEKACIERALEIHDGNKTRAAKALTMNRTTLLEKMRRYGLRQERTLKEKEEVLNARLDNVRAKAQRIYNSLVGSTSAELAEKHLDRALDAIDERDRKSVV